MKKVSMYIMAHKKFDVPQNEAYKPMQVGSALHEDLGYLRDDSGENISVKNPNYSELTGLYWMWKNDRDSEIIGLCHYRRYFLNDAGEILSAREINQILDHADIITSDRLVSGEKTLEESYIEKHNAQDLILTRQAVEKLYPEYIPVYDEVMGGRETYYGNLAAGKSCVIKDYAKWLFDIFDEVEKNMDLTDYNEYNSRVYGFISERLLMVWIKKNGLRPYESRVGLMGEKSESHEAVLKVGMLLSEGRENDAYAFLEEVNQRRPDLFFLDSDTNGELAKICRIVNIAMAEKKHPGSNILDYSRDYKQLLIHYDNIYGMLKSDYSGKRLINYLTENNVSVTAVLVIMGTLEFTPNETIQVFNYLAGGYLDAGDLNTARLYLGLALKQQ